MTDLIAQPHDWGNTGSNTRAPLLGVLVREPDSTTVILTATGELDEITTPHLEELLRARLESTIDTIVLDLSGLRFLGITPLHMLVAATRRADTRHITLRLIDGPPCVDRALRATNLVDHFDRGWPESADRVYRETV